MVQLRGGPWIGLRASCISTTRYKDLRVSLGSPGHGGRWLGLSCLAGSQPLKGAVSWARGPWGQKAIDGLQRISKSDLRHISHIKTPKETPAHPTRQLALESTHRDRAVIQWGLDKGSDNQHTQERGSFSSSSPCKTQPEKHLKVQAIRAWSTILPQRQASGAKSSTH